MYTAIVAIQRRRAGFRRSSKVSRKRSSTTEKSNSRSFRPRAARRTPPACPPCAAAPSNLAPLQPCPSPPTRAPPRQRCRHTLVRTRIAATRFCKLFAVFSSESRQKRRRGRTDSVGRSDRARCSEEPWRAVDAARRDVHRGRGFGEGDRADGEDLTKTVLEDLREAADAVDGLVEVDEGSLSAEESARAKRRKDGTNVAPHLLRRRGSGERIVAQRLCIGWSRSPRPNGVLDDQSLRPDLLQRERRHVDAEVRRCCEAQEEVDMQSKERTAGAARRSLVPPALGVGTMVAWLPGEVEERLAVPEANRAHNVGEGDHTEALIVRFEGGEVESRSRSQGLRDEQLADEEDRVACRRSLMIQLMIPEIQEGVKLRLQRDAFLAEESDLEEAEREPRGRIWGNARPGESKRWTERGDGHSRRDR